jgi:hypothetical protein
MREDHGGGVDVWGRGEDHAESDADQAPDAGHGLAGR